MADCDYLLSRLALRVSVQPRAMYLINADMIVCLKDLHIVHVHCHLQPADRGVQLLSAGRNAGVIILHLGPW